LDRVGKRLAGHTGPESWDKEGGKSLKNKTSGPKEGGKYSVPGNFAIDGERGGPDQKDHGTIETEADNYRPMKQRRSTQKGSWGHIP